MQDLEVVESGQGSCEHLITSCEENSLLTEVKQAAVAAFAWPQTPLVEWRMAFLPSQIREVWEEHKKVGGV